MSADEREQASPVPRAADTAPGEPGEPGEAQASAEAPGGGPASAPRGEASPSEPPPGASPEAPPVAGEAQAPAVAPPRAPAPPPDRRGRFRGLAEEPEVAIGVPRDRLAAQSRRDFLLYAAGVLASATVAWWLLPDRTKARLAPGAAHDRLETIAARVGLTRERAERTLNRALTFDDDIAEALFSKDRRVRTYDRSQVTPLMNNYDGQTAGPEYLSTWALQVSGLASGRIERLAIASLLARFPIHEQVTRLVCVEGWSAVAWWGGIRFAEFLAAFPPAPGAKWAALRSSVNLDGAGRPDPYYVSIDLETARHPQTLLATHHNGWPLTLAHGAPMRLIAPMKLGLKNIKAVTDIAYTAAEPADYWNEQGYSRYDGL